MNAQEQLVSLVEMRNMALRQDPSIRRDAITLAAVLKERADRYAQYFADHPPDATVITWAARMAAKAGPWVRVRYFVADWITALYLMTAGEEPTRRVMATLDDRDLTAVEDAWGNASKMALGLRMSKWENLDFDDEPEDIALLFGQAPSHIRADDSERDSS
ncbi:MAG: hypothetical protein ACO1Q7_02100 [Gemmatimonas sp.]